jgi:hypothetical protein
MKTCTCGCGAEATPEQPTRYAFIARTFDATRTIWSDDERTIEGYDGEHRTMLYLFNTPEERDAVLCDMQVTYGENAERGDDMRTLWVGVLDGRVHLAPQGTPTAQNSAIDEVQR